MAAPVDYETAESASISTLEDFEKNADSWTASSEAGAMYTESTFPRLPSMAYEGDKVLVLMGKEGNTSSMGASMSFVRIPDLSKAKALCVAVAIMSGAPEGTEYTVTLSAGSLDKSVSKSTKIQAGVWYLCYLPLTGINAASVSDISVSFTSIAPEGQSWAPEAYVDYVHSSDVGGPWQSMPYTAAAFKASRGSIEYTDEGMEYTVNASSPYIQSCMVNAVMDGKINALAITIKNTPGISSATLYTCPNNAPRYTDTYSSSAEFADTDGLCTYYFPLTGLKKGDVLTDFRITFSGRVRGTLLITEIRLCNTYFPPDADGELSVSVKDGKISALGTFSYLPKDAKNVELYAFLPGEDINELAGKTPIANCPAAKSFSFEFEATDTLSLCKYVAVAKGGTYTASTGNGAFLSLAASLPGGIFKGAVSDSSVSKRLMADSVYYTVDIALLEKDADTPLPCPEGGFQVNGGYMEKLVSDIKGMESDGMRVFAVLDLTSSKTADTVEGTSLPLMTASGAHFVAALARFIADSAEPSFIGLLCDAGDTPSLEASLYIYEYYIAAASGAASANKPCPVIIALDCAEEFDTLSALSSRLNSTSLCPVIIHGTDADVSALSTLCPVMLASDEGISPEEYVRLYSEHIKSGAKALFIPADENTAPVFEIIDSKNAPELISALLPDASVTVPSGTTVLSSHEAEHRRAPYTDINDIALWQARTGCRYISEEVFGQRSAVSIIFDAEGTDQPFAYCSLGISGGEYLIIELYADYLPQGKDSTALSLYVHGINSRISSSVTLVQGEAVSVAIPVSGMSVISGIDLYVDERGGTPRISVLGFGIEDPDATVAESETESESLATESVSEAFTETEGAEDSEKRDDTSLLIITLCVIIAMFLILGGIIFYLDKTRGKRDTP